MNFIVISKSTFVPDSGVNTVYLRIDNWNDFAFRTMFEVDVFDENGKHHKLENVKIGFIGQTEEVTTHSTLSIPFSELPKNYFSLGTDLGYYSDLANNFSEAFRLEFLRALRDVVYDHNVLATAQSENVFQTSHLRGVSINSIEEQFRRVLTGGVPVTDFNFRFTLEEAQTFAGFTLDFDVHANSKPSTNIHAIIGRNGVGKTTLLNEMISAIATPDDGQGRFEEYTWFEHKPIRDDFFSSMVSVSFSAFDPFSPPADQPDSSKGTCYYYVGLKDYADEDGALLKSLSDLQNEFVDSLKICLSESGKRQRWLTAVATLESDDNFAQMELRQLVDVLEEEVEPNARRLFKKMSSGHAVVLLTLTKLVSRVEEKTLVLFDEPESHLHPPLLSALVRSLSQLLYDRNAVAIIATHSPVVLQEIPKSCVWKIHRSGLASSWNRPESETFGENVGLLTREVFGLEVSKSGFSVLLENEVEAHETYEQVVGAFEGQIGFEGRAILRSLFNEKNRGG